VSHEETELTRLLLLNEDDARPSALNAPEDEREYDEYVTILETRVIDLGSIPYEDVED